MKQNKGFIGIGLIIAIVLGIAVVGGGAYYLGKGGEKKEVKVEENNMPVVEEQNKPVVEEQGKDLTEVENKKEEVKIVEDNKNFKTYTNKEYGIEFKYPSILTIEEKQWPNRSDLGPNYDPGYSIAVSVPFKNHYDAWTSKGFDITIHKSSCGDYLPTSMSNKKVVNGVSYVFEDPEWTGTSGMSSISKWRKYFHESSGKCYIISERISGLGNNERPSNYTFPSDVNKFLDGELIDLDNIMATFKIF